MAQADQTVQNASFPSVRTDINDNLAALFSQSSGNSAPAVTVAFQPWIDNSSSPAVWKVRNAANNGWITVGTIDATTFAVGGLMPIANGGTGATTASAALTNLLPSQAGNSGKALTTDGTAAGWGSVAAGASIQVFTSSGTYTPTAGKTTFLVIVTGGGGGGGGGFGPPGGNGGGGGTGIRFYTSAEMGSSASVTLGGGGTAGNVSAGYDNNGSAGGNTTFDPGGTGLTLTAAGGGGGNGGSNGGGNGGGGGSTNSIFAINGYGMISFWIAGRGFGGFGGAGFTLNGYPGGAGTAGVVLILEW